METQECSLCHRPAAWSIGTELFCEGHKEKLIEDIGVDRFPIRRLTNSERAFHVGGRFSRSIAKKKGRGKANGKNHRVLR
jgi:hypothetical protein